MSARQALGAASVLLLGLGVALAQEQPKPAEVGKKKQKREDVVARAYKRCVEAEDRTLLVMSYAPNDNATVITVAEYADGSIGVFQGDEERDDFVIISKDNIELIERIAPQARRRGR